MGHECEYCGTTFETLSRLRLHDCPHGAADTTADDDTSGEEWLADRQRERSDQRRRRGQRAASDALDEHLADAQAGSVDGAVMVLAQYEQDLNAAMEHSGDRFRDVFWAYYEPIADALDTVAQTHGWVVVLDLVDAYDPQAQADIPIGSAPLTNAVARSVIRTRLTDGVNAIPADALAYLASIPRCDTESMEMTWEESMHYGWGIDHPDHPVGDTIRDLVPVDEIWASAAAHRALYADQHAAADLFIDVLDLAPDEDKPLVVDRLSRLEGEPDWELFPRYWDIQTEFDRDFTFEWDDAVVQTLRAGIEASGVTEYLPDDWTFADLEASWW